MAVHGRRAGCGCCGCLVSFLFFFVVLVLIAAGFFYFKATTNLSRLAPASSVSSPATTFSRQTYAVATHKLDHFFADPGERNVAFSNAEVNALLAESPQLRILGRGTVVVLNQNSADVSCNLPLNLPFLPHRSLNYAFQTRPSMRGDEFVLDISKIEREGKPLGTAESREVQFALVPLVEKTLWGLNKIQMDRAVHEIRIENGNLILAR